MAALEKYNPHDPKHLNADALGQLYAFQIAITLIRKHAPSEVPIEKKGSSEDGKIPFSDEERKAIARGLDYAMAKYRSPETTDEGKALQKAYDYFIAAKAPRESGNRWVRKEDFRGVPNSCPLGWWGGRSDESEPYLDEILLDEHGRICGKGGCGADYYTHVMLADFERPTFPNNLEVRNARDARRTPPSLQHTRGSTT